MVWRRLSPALDCTHLCAGHAEALRDVADQFAGKRHGVPPCTPSLNVLFQKRRAARITWVKKHYHPPKFGQIVSARAAIVLIASMEAVAKTQQARRTATNRVMSRRKLAITRPIRFREVFAAERLAWVKCGARSYLS